MIKGKSIIGWKKLRTEMSLEGCANYWFQKFENRAIIAKLRIPCRALRTPAHGRAARPQKRRAEWAYVEALYYLTMTGKLSKIKRKDFIGYSIWDEKFEYKVGKKIVPSYFENSMRICADGIHFFTNLKDAKAW